MAQEWSVPLVPEIWENVFSFLPEHDLHSCWKVCQPWAGIIDALPPRFSWNPWFSGTHQVEATLTFRQTPGTRFESGDDVNSFLRNMPQCLAAEKTSTFINRTLIITASTTDSMKSLHEALPEFAKDGHGSSVHKLLHHVDELVPQSLENLAMVLKTMKNLKSLTIQVADRIPQHEIVLGDFPHLEHLTELEFLGDKCVFLFEQLAIKYGEQIWSLHWWCFINPDRLILAYLFPNLTNLKLLSSGVGYPAFMLPFNFKTFVYKTKTANTAVRDIHEELSCAMILARYNPVETLAIYTPLPVKKSVENFIKYEFAIFLVLTEFVVPYYFVEEMPVLQHLMKSFPSLKTLVLVDTKNIFENRDLNLEELNGLLDPLFQQLAVPLKKIVIRTRNFHKEIRQFLPKIYECTRTPNQLG